MATWQIVSTPNTGTNTIGDIISVAADAFVAVGTNGTVLTSDDGGLTWTPRTAAENNAWGGVASDGTTVVAVAATGTNRVMISTDDGHTWIPKAAASADQWTSVTYVAFLDMFVAVSNSVGLGTKQIMVSTDAGSTWTNVTSPGSQTADSVAASGTRILAITLGAGANITSTDGATFTAGTTPATFAQIFGGGSLDVDYSSLISKFVLGGRDSVTNTAKAAYTTAAAAWTYSAAAPLTNYFTFLTIKAANSLGGFVGTIPYDAAIAPTATTHIAESTDGGATWTDDNTGLAWGEWTVGGWDDATSTVVFWDNGQTNRMLVGSFAGLTSISPDHGPKRGGTPCTISGIGLGTVAQGDVLFDDNVAGSVVPASDGLSVRCNAPGHAAGVVDVVVTGIGTLAAAYAYVTVTSVTPSSGTTAGGTAVTITGVGFTFATGDPTFDGVVATSVVFVSDTSITCVTPTHPTGVVDVIVPGVDILKRGYVYGTPPDTLPPMPVTSDLIQ